MPGNNDSESRGCRVNVDFLDVMEDVNADTFEFQRQVQRYPGRPRSLVVVASDCMNRCDPSQLVQDLRTSDITRVNDVSDARERAHRFRPKQSVGIRDEANRCHLPPIVPGLVPVAQLGEISDCQKSIDTEESRT